ncbi:MAG TPA: hypothetical protein VGI74_22680 [Streptosporangiaceae bacterium]|jgi:hypothetical protein
MIGSVYRRPPADVLAAVEIVLRDLGFTRLYRCVDPRIGVGVLSVACGVTAWCDGRTVEWWHSGEDARWSAADPGGAAQQLAKLVGIDP